MKNSRGTQLDPQLLGPPQLAMATEDQLPGALSKEAPGRARNALENPPGAWAQEAAPALQEEGANPPENELAPGEPR